ncbi:M18 family aminopeptidase [Corynebacterium genitalium ATCC 33030]|uniref:M18 family aminopeptidase n=1 Tax=Corynebacterium genitalium ATCC 33030 TaxID=585529 RepID=D7WCS8_9CORY|nr:MULTISPECIES: M18 family aminopeptidase [Corynebacterium]EFK53959.1 aminopeptidase I zinc metalloprotease (M18) [Corynebacterium genitalium ATCC 33030]MCQ4620500.1 M18 family aminopeptidase [Corynebacterium sp. CCUG 71335]UUA88499.1 M18 family aminopeptidase [Corynebacterium genitalium ATCC 33030]
MNLSEFIAASPSAFHAAANVRDELVAAGFPDDQILVHGGAVIAWWIPENPNPRFRIIGSHTDSPGLMLKPDPDFVREGFRQLAVEVYGGPILSSWFDRELTFAGRVSLIDGSTHLVSTGPIARVPNLAIHLYRGDAPEMDRQVHMQPVMAVDRPFMDVVAEQLGVKPEEIIAHELSSADAQPPVVMGDVMAAGRLDNLSSVHASLQAMVRAKDEVKDVLVLAAFNHEEVGSASATGAGGPLLERVLTRVARDLGDPLDIFAESTMISADAAHAVHPNYPGKHDPTHRPLMNRGPVLKINANQRYSSDAETEATWIRACRNANVPVQTFVGHNGVPCGSTIGPIASTRLGIPTVDVGVPLLSMHSARELVGVQDQAWFEDALSAFLRGDC